MQNIHKTLILLFLLALSYLSASTWEPPMTVSTAEADTTYAVTIASDDNANAALAWTQSGEVYSSYRPFGGGWEPPHSHGKGKDIQICMDGSGNITVAFIQDDGTSDLVRTDFRPAGGVWVGAVTRYTAATINTLTELAIHCIRDNFYGMIAWLDQSGTDPVVHTLSRQGNGTGWSSFGVVAINDPSNNTVTAGTAPIPRIQSNGTSVCLLKTTNTGTVQVNYASFNIATLTATSTWNPAPGTPLPDLGFSGGVFGTPPERFDFDMNRNGNAVVGVSTFNDQVAAAVSTNASSSWTTPVLVDPNPSKWVEAAIDNFGFATLAWIQAAPANISTASTSVFAPSWVWIIQQIGSINTVPSLNSSPNGGSVLAWDDGSADLNAKVGFQGDFETPPVLVDLNSKVESVSMSNRGVAFAAWLDASTGLVEASRTIVEAQNLINVLGKKRLIYQKGLYP